MVEKDPRDTTYPFPSEPTGLKPNTLKWYLFYYVT